MQVKQGNKNLGGKKCQFSDFRAERKKSSWREKVTSRAENAQAMARASSARTPRLGFITTKYNKLLHSTSRWKGCPRHGQRNPLLWWLPPTWAGPTHFSKPRRRHVAMRRRRRQPTWVRISRTSTCKIYLMVCVISPVLYIAPIIEPMRSSHGIHGILTASR